MDAPCSKGANTSHRLHSFVGKAREQRFGFYVIPSSKGANTSHRLQSFVGKAREQRFGFYVIP